MIEKLIRMDELLKTVKGEWLLWKR